MLLQEGEPCLQKLLELGKELLSEGARETSACLSPLSYQPVEAFTAPSPAGQGQGQRGWGLGSPETEW